MVGLGCWGCRLGFPRDSSKSALARPSLLALKGVYDRSAKEKGLDPRAGAPQPSC